MWPDLAPIGAKIRGWRKEAGLTQRELAERAGIAPATLSRLERTGQCGLLTLLRVVFALGRRPEEAFAGLAGQPPPPAPPPLREERPREGAKREFLGLLRRCRGRLQDTQAGIAEKIHFSRSTTRRALRELEVEEKIVIRRRPRGSRCGHLYLLREALTETERAKKREEKGTT